MAVVAVCTMACKEDKPIADSVVGSYSGTLEMTVAGNSAGSIDLSVVITKTSDAVVSMAIVNEAPAGAMSIGHLDIDGISVADAGNSTYTLSKETPDGGFTVVDTGSSSQTAWTFKSFTGTFDGTTLTLNMVAQPGAMPMPITMVYKGSK